MNVIFLDIDGVLNSVSFSNKNNYYQYLDTSCQIDPNTIDLLNYTIDELFHEPSFVISSSWKDIYNIDQIVDILEHKGFRGKIIDSTPTIIFPSDDMGLIRLLEIEEWLEDCKIIVDRFVILDDLEIQSDDHILIDYKVGLTKKDCRKIIKMLNNL